MTVENFSSTNLNTPNQEQVSVNREDDGSVSISISANASATAKADGESSTKTAKEVKQAKSDMDGTETLYPKDQASEDSEIGTREEKILNATEDLATKINEVIELLGGKSDNSTDKETNPTVSDTPADANQPDTSGGDKIELAERLESVLSQLEQIIGELSSDETGEEPNTESPADQFIFKFLNSTDEGKAEVIEMLESGEFGEAGKKIAEILPNLTTQLADDMFVHNNDAENEINEILNDNPGLAEQLQKAIEPIYEEHQEVPTEFPEPVGPGDVV